MDHLGRWSVDFYDFTAPHPTITDEGVAWFGDVHERATRNGARHGTPILLSPSGYADPRVNLFFRTGAMAAAAVTTMRRYAYALAVWLEFLGVFGRSWDKATVRDVEAFKDWRLTDLRNEGRVRPTSFDTDRAALNTFYRWAFERYGIRNPVSTVRTGRPGPRRPVTARWNVAAVGVKDRALLAVKDAYGGLVGGATSAVGRKAAADLDEVACDDSAPDREQRIRAELARALNGVALEPDDKQVSAARDLLDRTGLAGAEFAVVAARHRVCRRKPPSRPRSGADTTTGSGCNRLAGHCRRGRPLCPPVSLCGSVTVRLLSLR